MAILTNRLDLNFASINASASGDNVIVADPGGSLLVKVVNYVLVADAAVTAQFKGTGAATGAMSLVANSGISANGGGLPMFATAGGLKITLGGAVGVRGHIAYMVE